MAVPTCPWPSAHGSRLMTCSDRSANATIRPGSGADALRAAHSRPSRHDRPGAARFATPMFHVERPHGTPPPATRASGLIAQELQESLELVLGAEVQLDPAPSTAAHPHHRSGVALQVLFEPLIAAVARAPLRTSRRSAQRLGLTHAQVPIQNLAERPGTIRLGLSQDRARVARADRARLQCGARLL